MAGSCPRAVAVSEGLSCWHPHGHSPSPCSTEASPELRARILESLIVASDVAEVPAAPGKRCPAGVGGEWEHRGVRADGGVRGWLPSGPLLAAAEGWQVPLAMGTRG